MTDPIRFKLGLAGGLVTDAEGDWITYRTHVAAIARLTHERDALFGKLAEARVGAERYRFIKQWARRLDITGYSLTNNEHFEPRIDEAMAIASQPSSADVERRPCTCHPDDNPPVPCPRMYALQDCRRAAALAAEIESLRARLAEAETLLREIREDARHFGMPTARIDAHLSREGDGHRCDVPGCDHWERHGRACETCAAGREP